MSKYKLDQEEKALLEGFDTEEFESVMSEERRALLEKSAVETVKKDKRINIRISSRDLSALQRRALEEGIPYQTLVSSILHKYVSGGLHDVTSNKVHYQVREK